jgi:hypothetical protein
MLHPLIVASSRGAQRETARNGPNRRRYRRVPAAIHCRPAGVEFFAPHMEPIDISFGGLRIYADEAYEVGACLRIDVFFPRVAPATFATEVMWIKTLGKGAPARVELGLAFVDLTPDSLDLLRPLLAPGPGSTSAPKSSAQVAPRADSSHDFDTADPVSEVRSVTPKPATVGQHRSTRPMLSDIPVLAAGADHLRAAQLDGRAGFVLSLIDGVTSVESILDLSGMPVEQTLGILEDLRQRGIVELR